MYNIFKAYKKVEVFVLKKARSIICLIITLLMIISFVSCSKVPTTEIENQPEESIPETKEDHSNEKISEPVAESSDKQEPIIDPEPEIEPEAEVIRNPLTGEPIDEDISMNRPVAIMINNISVAQPQLGLSNSDIIFEALVEGGITRMMAVFQTLPENTAIGSIRSCRHDYLDFAASLDAIYIHAGASDIGDEKLIERNTDHIDALKQSNIFYRDQYRRNTMGFEHSLCCNSNDIKNYLSSQSKFSLTHNDGYSCNMVFSDKPEINGDNASSVIVAFGKGNKTTSFTYSSDIGNYYAEQYGNSYYDGNTNEKIPFKNIVVIQTNVSTIDSEGHQDMDITGNGNGWYICNGKCAKITWSRENQDAQFVFTNDKGSNIVYGVGRTYIAVIANDGSVKVS